MLDVAVRLPQINNTQDLSGHLKECADTLLEAQKSDKMFLLRPVPEDFRLPEIPDGVLDFDSFLSSGAKNLGKIISGLHRTVTEIVSNEGFTTHLKAPLLKRVLELVNKISLHPQFELFSEEINKLSVAMLNTIHNFDYPDRRITNLEHEIIGINQPKMKPEVLV